MKEVKKGALLNLVFSYIKAGKKPTEISKELNISKQQLQYYLTKLKKEGAIRKVGYGVWQTSKDKVDNSIRGHGFMWTIKVPKEIKIWEQILTDKNIHFKKINKGFTFQIVFNDRILHLNKSSIQLYDIKSYFGENAVQSKKYAMFELKSLLDALESKLGVYLKTNEGNYIAKVSRQHYSLIKNCMAIQCNKDNEKINVYNKEGLWFTIDNSFNLDEAETIHPRTALVDSLGVQRFFNEHKELKWEMTPKKTLEMIHGISKNQIMFDKNFQSHLEVINKLSKAVNELREEIKNLKNVKN